MKPNASATKKPWVDPDDEPELPQEWFDSAEVVKDGRVIRKGRPPAENPKVSVTMRLDADIVAWLRETGPGWQTRVNDALQALRRVAKPESR